MRTNGLVDLAARQRGVFARWQALELGYSHYQVARRIEVGDWRRVVGSVLTAGTTVLDRPGEEWAGYLAAGPGAVLSGPSAAARHGIEGEPSHVWVTIPPERHLNLPGIRAIRESLPDRDVVLLDGMRVTNPARTVVDCLRVMPAQTGRHLLDRSLLRGWLTVEELTTRVVSLAGRRGVGRVRDQLSRVSTGARSEAERALHAILEGAGLTGWTADHPVRDEYGVLIAVLDLAFVEARLAIEVDGLAYHTDPERFQHDRARQNWLVTNGWTVLRFTWDDLIRRPRAVLQTILAALSRSA